MVDRNSSLRYHGGKFPGKIQIGLRKKLNNSKDLIRAYTPGVGEICEKIYNNGNKNIDQYTSRWNSVAIVTNGTRVLGLGNLGPYAALPVIEGKAMIYKKVGNVDAFPLCINEKNWKNVVKIITQLVPNFKLFQLEDIKNPEAFHIQKELEKNKILSFHDDRHGTATVVLAGLFNALKLITKEIKKCEIVILGAGTAGLGITEILLHITKKITLVDSKGIVHKNRKNLNSEKKRFVKNIKNKRGTLEDALKNADILIAASKPNIITEAHIKLMNKNPIIFALSNPVPEINPKLASKYGIVGTSRSDFPNQINNSLAFPGIARGLLDSGAKEFRKEIIIAAARGIASSVKPRKNKIVPSSLDKNNTYNVALEVFKECKRLKISRSKMSVNKYKIRLKEILNEN